MWKYLRGFKFTRVRVDGVSESGKVVDFVIFSILNENRP